MSDNIVRLHFHDTLDGTCVTTDEVVTREAGDIVNAMYRYLKAKTAGFLILREYSKDGSSTDICATKFVRADADDTETYKHLAAQLDKYSKQLFVSGLKGGFEIGFVPDSKETLVAVDCDNTILIGIYSGGDKNSKLGEYLLETAIYYAATKPLNTDMTLQASVSTMTVDRRSSFMDIYDRAEIEIGRILSEM